MNRIFLSITVVLFAAILGSCDSGTGSETTTGVTELKKEFVLGDLIEPFTPPTLEELEKQVEWIDQPVLDSMVLLRKRQEGEKVLATVNEALQLKNDSVANNDKICSTMGRLPKSNANVNWDASILRHERADVKSTNPLMASSVTESRVNSLTGFGLFSFDWNFTPFASKDTVVSWQRSKDYKYDKVVMREDLTWSDGKPITAHDIVFSFRVILSEQVPVPAQRTGTDKIKWIEAYDDHTLVFFHKEPLATNVWNINFSIIPKHIYKKSIHEDPTLQDSEYHVNLEENPVVGGGYIISKRTRGQEIVLTAREDWYMHKGKQVRDRPHFMEIRIRIISDPNVALLALKKGEIEEYQITPAQWRTQTNGAAFYNKNTKAHGLEWVYFYFGWNCKTVYFSDPRVRQAMSHAFNHDEMLKKIFFNLYESSNGVFHRTSKWAPKNPQPPYKQNLDMAEKLLEEAGWVDSDGDGIRDKTINGRKQKFEFSILVFNNPERIATCNLLRENLDQIGIICHIRPLEFTVLQEKSRNHDFHAIHAGWGTGADPDTAENIWGTGQGRNYVNYSDPEVDRLFEAGRKAFDVEERAKIYRKIHAILYRDQPYTWLYFRNSFFGFNKELRGYNFSPRGPYGYGPGFSSLWKSMR